MQIIRKTCENRVICEAEYVTRSVKVVVADYRTFPGAHLHCDIRPAGLLSASEKLQ